MYQMKKESEISIANGSNLFSYIIMLHFSFCPSKFDTINLKLFLINKIAKQFHI